MSYPAGVPDDAGPRCICGDVVAVAHVECMAMLEPEERRKWPRLPRIDGFDLSRLTFEGEAS